MLKFYRVMMNPDLNRLQTYPFQKLSTLLQGVVPDPGSKPISLYIGEPKHPTPEFIRKTLVDNLDGLAVYPLTLGAESLRVAVADWLKLRYGLKQISAQSEIIPINGSREALFAFAQTIVDRSRPDPVVVLPNPFYQIYEGAAILSGATPHYLNMLPQNNFALDFTQLAEETWNRTQLVYVCTPGNPTGRVMDLRQWQQLFELSDRHGFVIASDECYSEIYFDETRPPLGALQAAQHFGRTGYPRLVTFSSLSKRSNVPGMRSGFVAGDADILKQFLLYRTYHGGAMSPPIHAASIVAWQDEAHVAENRRLYRDKFATATAILQPVIKTDMPEAGFYLWIDVGGDDTVFTSELYRRYNVSVLPGSFLAREAHGVNPGTHFVRIALVASTDECAEAAQRIAQFIRNR
jgi:N-succinyldiaminopimelate aminotransferase